MTRLFQDVNLNETKYLHQIYYVNNQLCYLSASKIRNKDGIPELQVIISFCRPYMASQTYKKRWEIETAFKALKTSGFNIEDTHLVDSKRIEKLFALVILAFTWAYPVGIFLHEKVKPIRLLKNGRRAKSFFKYGLDYIAAILLNPYSNNDIDLFQFLSCT